MRNRRRRLALTVAIVLSLVVPQPIAAREDHRRGDADHHRDEGEQHGRQNVHSFDANLGVAWFNKIYELVRDSPGFSPPVASRAYGYCGVAFYEALVHGIEHGRSLAGQLNGLDELPRPSRREHHWPTVANAALQTVTKHFFPASSGASDALAEQFYREFGRKLPRSETQRSIAYGVELAEAILDWAAGDGIAQLAAANGAFVPPVVEGPWVGGGLGLQPAWGSLRTFAIESATSCPALGHPSHSEDPSSAFYAYALLVRNTTGDAGAALTEDQRDIAFFWSDGAGGTGTPPGHWVSIVGLIAQQHELDLATVAQAYARVGVAMADGFISCWKTKFETYLLRPITYIQSEIDAQWDPLLTTPNFPTYTSGHSTQSGAAATVLTHQLGALPFLDTTHVDRNNVAVLPQLVNEVRSFDSLMQAANEAAISRLYGGIHYLFDNHDGLAQGICIGQHHVDRLDFRD